MLQPSTNKKDAHPVSPLGCKPRFAFLKVYAAFLILPSLIVAEWARWPILEMTRQPVVLGQQRRAKLKDRLGPSLAPDTSACL